VRNLVKTLVRHKLIKASDDVKAFLEEYPKEIRAKLEKIAEEIVVLSNEEIEPEVLKKIIINKIDELNIDVSPSNLEAIYMAMAQKATKDIKDGIKDRVAFSFDSVDSDAVAAMRKNFYWIKQEYNKKIQEELKNIIEESFNGDLERTKLPKVLKEQFGYVIDRDERYFKGVADHIILQNQNVVRALQGEKYGVEHYKIVAVMDKRTSAICRSMHGRIIPASHIHAQAKSILNAKSMAEKKGAAAWRSSPMLSKELPSNFGLPPYHFRCRTEALPVWIGEEEVDGKTTKSTTNRGKDEILRHIDKIGVERRVSKNNWEEHISKKHTQLELKDIISALDSIEEIAPHSKIEERVVTKSTNGVFMVFDGDELVSAYRPTNPQNKPNLDNHFKANAKADEIEIIR
jgi:hypothetical protein